MDRRTRLDDRLDDRLDAPSAVRNCQPIMEVLERFLPNHGSALEIASGSGQHVVAFAQRFPQLTWRASDPDPQARRSVSAWADDAGLDVGTPLNINTRDDGWPDLPVDDCVVVLAINMIHISPWESTIGLFRGASRLLQANGIVFLYGPYRINGEHTAPSTAAFDQSLRSRDPAWRVRDLDAVARVAEDHGFHLADTVAMPANNFSVIFRLRG